MNETDLQLFARKFPLSASTLRRNQAGAQIPHPEQRERAPELGAGDAGETSCAGFFRVRFTLYRVRLLDVDAKWSSVKDLLDCVAACGLVAGDKEGQISLEVFQEKVGKRDQERTEIYLTL